MFAHFSTITSLAICGTFLNGYGPVDLAAGAANVSHRRAIIKDRDAIDATLVRIDRQWNATFDADGQKAQIASSSLVRWGNPRDLQDGFVVLCSGGWLVADEVQITENSIRLTNDYWPRASIPRGQIRGVIFRVRPDSKARDRALLGSATSASPLNDVVVLDNGDSVSGDVLAANLEFLRMNVGSDKVELVADRVEAILLKAGAKPESTHEARAIVGFRDGSVIEVSHAEFDRDESLFETCDGIKLAADRDLTDDVVFWQPLGIACVYLSDLEPAGYRHVPFLRITWPLGVDRNLFQGRIRVQGKIYAKGLSMHSPSRVVYRLDQQYRKLAAEVAVDDTAGRSGSVIFRVFVDFGKGQWQQAFQSQTVRGGDAPVPVSVEIGGARQLALIVDMADRTDQLDHAVWLDARLIK